MTDRPFSYSDAFSRNIGWVTRDEQQTLRGKRIAIAGMGGVGSSHLLTMARLGVASFHIADFDQFDIPNFNRQVGATMSTIGAPKAQVMADMARDINPEIDIKIFPLGVNADNLDDFLDGVDLYIDSLDFFVFAVRQMTFAACARLAIPAITAAPLGMGTGVINFLPGHMTFEQYFQWGDLAESEKAIRFLVGLAPAGLHRHYLVDASSVNLAERRGPSTFIAVQLCAGFAAAQALKILLKRGKVMAAPHGMQFDGYRDKLVHTWRPGGNRNPIQRLAIMIGRRQMAKLLLVAESRARSGAAPG